MAREWEVAPVKEHDANDYWYVMSNERAKQVAARRFHPEQYTEADLRNGEPRMFKDAKELRYLMEIIRRKNSFRG